jgi:hypothetical protein
VREDGARGDISAVHMDSVDAREVSVAQQGSESMGELPPHSLPLDLRSLLVAPESCGEFLDCSNSLWCPLLVPCLNVFVGFYMVFIFPKWYLCNIGLLPVLNRRRISELPLRAAFPNSPTRRYSSIFRWAFGGSLAMAG